MTLEEIVDTLKMLREDSHNLDTVITYFERAIVEKRDDDGIERD